MNKFNGQADAKIDSRTKSANAVSGNEDDGPISKRAMASACAAAQRWLDRPENYRALDAGSSGELERLVTDILSAVPRGRAAQG